ncbi:MAG TPA: DUF2950 domain-containing protein [Usitatibacter sp.]|nr:DUF2950 domain-containing protein [Usitatibacter sp.]
MIARTAVMLLAMLVAASDAVAAGSVEKSFATPEEAASALVSAVRANDRAAVLAVLGNAGDWISSGDAAADRATAENFVAEYGQKHAIVPEGDHATLTIGDEDFPFAFPLVQREGRWRFDSVAGKEELLRRRIGRNELSTIQVLEAIVDAEREYASVDRDGDGVMTYAQKFASTAGKHDGLYWPVKAGEPPSPLGELVVKAANEGYGKQKAPAPYHGYNFRMLKGQTRNAESGAFDYVVRGRGIGGFAVLAWPAKYGNSGIMSFMVNQDGKVYQADLGPQTRQKAEKMTRFDPAAPWAAVDASSSR